MTAEFPAAIAALRDEGMRRLSVSKPRITVGLGTCGRAAGGDKVMESISETLGEQGDLGIDVVSVGCRGLCYAEPLVEVALPEEEPMLYSNVDAAYACKIASAVLEGKYLEVTDEHRVDGESTAGQERRVLSDCGRICPTSLEEYLAVGGYSALLSALSEMEPSEVVDLVQTSGLRGRGGAGYPTGKKWASCAEQEETVRYFIVNGDEGDPGAYMDRGLLESDPHRVLEGLIIGCYATGAHQAYFFIRAEYPLAVRTIQTALDDARAAGLIGSDILGSGFDLEVGIVRGAGAFLCGEATAMANVLENRECTTRKRPPHMTESGLWGKPTCLNNVETLANVPLIVSHGAEWFRGVGTEASPGTKVFSVVGAVERSGLVEVPLGTPLKTIVNDIARAKDPKAVQIGGPSGVILPSSMGDLEVSFEGLKGVDGMMGSGGFVVLGTSQCIVDIAHYLTDFSSHESCRRCKACREGLIECEGILARITRGEGTEEDLETLRARALKNRELPLCGLGRTALNPVLSSLTYFRDEYEAHLRGECPGHVCRDLISYAIDTSKCHGERCCLLTCPGNAVKGPFGKPGRIVLRLCQKCGMCVISCPYGAVEIVSPAVV